MSNKPPVLGNPNHPVTQMMEGQWHKLCAIMVMQQGGEVVLTSEDVQKVIGMHITVQELDDGIHLKVVDDDEARRLMIQEGGLPI